MSEEPDFALGDALAAFGLTKPAYVEDLIRIAVSEGKIERQLWDIPDHPRLPSKAWLIGWPNVNAGLLCLVLGGRGGANHTFTECWPFARCGIVHRMQVARAHSDASGVITLLEGAVGDLKLTVFDTFCGALGRGVEAGDGIVVRLHAWAATLTRSASEPLRFRREDLQPSTRDAFASGFDEEGVLTIHTQGMTSLFPAAGMCPLHQLRSPVKAVRLGQALLGMAVWVLTVTLGRPDDEDIDIELSVTSGVWSGPAPAVGDDIEGFVWMQASFD